jgi:DNA-directed RNA polymerase subunit M/transcription elongation factor TFIIS
MITASDASRKYPVVCPKCGGIAGYPFQVRTLIERPGSIEIRLRCRECGHEWVDVVVSDRN